MRIRHAIKTLQRRQEFLRRRIKSLEGVDLSHDLAEKAALEIAIRCIQMAVDYGVIALTNQAEPLFRGQTDYLEGEVGRRPGRARGNSNVEA
jgi:hypothetical protein